MLKATARSPRRCTAEHLVARCEGGPDTIQNIVAACWLCNNRRHRRKVSLSAQTYLDHVRQRIAKGKWLAMRSIRAKMR
ncbi:MAG: HNH endonuclease [Hyphomicrobiaceae bacterium]|nr:HNH endonuclease [Hyphomicrobiaceae bacterium]